MKSIILACVFAAAAWAQCGKLVVNPMTGKMDCVGNSSTTAAGWTDNGTTVSTARNVSVGNSVLALAPTGSDSTAALTAALAAFTTANPGTISLVAGGTYVITSPITLDISKVSLLNGNGATIDASSITSGTALTITASTSVLACQKAVLSDVKLIGNSKAGSATGMLLDTVVSGAGVAYPNFSNVMLSTFGTCLTIGRNAYIDSFSGFAAVNCTVGVNIGTGVGSGERITFSDSVFASNTTALLVTGAPQATTVFVRNSSFDNNDTAVSTSAGVVAISDAHFESTLNTDYWLKASGNGLIRVSGGMFWPNVARTYELGTSSSTKLGGISLVGVYIAIPPTYVPQSLIAGVGRGICSELHSDYDTTTAYLYLLPTCSVYATLLADGEFEAYSTPVDFSTNAHALIATDQAHSGTHSLKFSGASGYITITKSISVTPGAWMSASFWVKMNLTTVGDQFFFNINWLDSQGTVLGGTAQQVTATTAWKELTVSAQPMKGAVNAQLQFGNYSPDGTLVSWIDDMIVTGGR